MFGSFQELGVLERVDRGYSWVQRGGGSILSLPVYGSPPY